MLDNVFEQLFDDVDEFKADTIRQLEEEYEDVSEELLYWLMLFSSNNKLDWVSMKEHLTESQLKRLKRYLGDEIEDRVRVKRIDAINLILENKLYEINEEYAKKLREFEVKLYEDTYYKTSYDTQKEKNEYWVVLTLSAESILKSVLTPWTVDKTNFIDRIHIKSESLLDKIKQRITHAILRGESPDIIINSVKKELGISANQAKNIINTESTRVVSEASHKAAQDSGAKEYTYKAVLDHRTSIMCQEMNGRRFKITEYEIGITAPPLHNHCRSYITWDTDKTGVEDKSIRIYEHWHKVYIRDKERE